MNFRLESRRLLRIAASLLFLLSVFGYLFPNWGNTVFSANENLFHLVTAVVAIVLTASSPTVRWWTVAGLAAVFLALGILGFSEPPPVDIHLKTRLIVAHLDLFDTIVHLIAGLVLTWLWLNRPKLVS